MSRARVTVEDVARRAGVSTATVSRAVNASARVSEETLVRVQSAIADLGFRPSPAARNLRQQRTRTVALVTPSITNPFFPELVACVQPELSRRGYSLLLIDTQQPECEAVRVAEARLVDGVLFVASDGESGGSRRILETDVPMVAFDRSPSALLTDVVQCDHEAGARAVTEHLLSLGHRRIAHIRGPARLDVARQRARGYRSALTGHGLSVDERLVVGGSFDETSGFTAVQELINREPRLTAIFAANDLMAIGAMAAAREMGIRVPADLAIAGFDGIRLGSYMQPTLTTYAQPISEMAQRAVGLLVEAIERCSSSPSPARRKTVTQRLTGHIVIRGSTEASARNRRHFAAVDEQMAYNKELTSIGGIS